MILGKDSNDRRGKVGIMLDVEKIRKDFPMLQNQPELIYFDNGATTLKPQCVIDAVMNFYLKHTSNIHRGDYQIAMQNDQLFDGTRSVIAKLIGCKSQEVVFTSNVTASLNQVAYGLQHNFLKAGDVVLTTLAEHASYILPLFRLQKEEGIKVEYVELDKEANISLEKFRQAMHPGVKAVMIAQMTNVLGSIQPIKEIAEIAHKNGALVIVDGAQAVPRMAVNVKGLDCDFYGFSSHKMCGPDGVGVLYGKYNLLQKMDPMLLGGDMNAQFDKDGNMKLKDPPGKFEAGTPNIEGVIGLKAAAEYLMNIGLDNIHEYEKELRSYLYEGLSQLDNVVIYNPENEFGPIDFNVKGVIALDSAGFLASRGIAVRSGNHCARALHNVIGTDWTVRASPYFYNTRSEADRFVAAANDISLESATGSYF